MYVAIHVHSFACAAAAYTVVQSCWLPLIVNCYAVHF